MRRRRNAGEEANGIEQCNAGLDKKQKPCETPRRRQCHVITATKACILMWLQDVADGVGGSGVCFEDGAITRR